MARKVPAPASPLRHWSAWLPVAASVFLIALGLRHVAITGRIHETDEGAEAHLFQMLMPLQALVIAYFALQWVPRRPRLALGVIGLQIAAAGAVFALVYWIEHP